MITLTKGKWVIYIGKLLNPASTPTSTDNTWVRLTLSSSSTTQVNTGFTFLSSSLVSGWMNNINNTNRFTFLSGIIPVEVTSTTLTLYLRTREYTSIGTPPIIRTRGSFGENYLFAISGY